MIYDLVSTNESTILQAIDELSYNSKYFWNVNCVATNQAKQHKTVRNHKLQNKLSQGVAAGLLCSLVSSA